MKELGPVLVFSGLMLIGLGLFEKILMYITPAGNSNFNGIEGVTYRYIWSLSNVTLFIGGTVLLLAFLMYLFINEKKQ
ncbi:hypothetical protein [Paenibacillus lutrae]|uniref:Uncharacterized protein n=1 Tax=Paenibacillus lutrae TaxID=2078573 RepID=A0A7X3JYE3_9BACL|nr:hypothetical protein [Paenibacillus lutrae]MVO99033.1 hypothetical protein [Paenibacillus lutrae]